MKFDIEIFLFLSKINIGSYRFFSAVTDEGKSQFLVWLCVCVCLCGGFSYVRLIASISCFPEWCSVKHFWRMISQLNACKGSFLSF